MKKPVNHYPYGISKTFFYLLFGSMFAIFLALGNNAESYLQSMFLTKEKFEAWVIFIAAIIMSWQVMTGNIKYAWALGFDWVVFCSCLIFYNDGMQNAIDFKVLTGYFALLYSITCIINLSQPHPTNKFLLWVEDRATIFRDNHRKKQISKNLK